MFKCTFLNINLLSYKVSTSTTSSLSSRTGNYITSTSTYAPLRKSSFTTFPRAQHVNYVYLRSLHAALRQHVVPWQEGLIRYVVGSLYRGVQSRETCPRHAVWRVSSWPLVLRGLHVGGSILDDGGMQIDVGTTKARGIYFRSHDLVSEYTFSRSERRVVSFIACVLIRLIFCTHRCEPNSDYKALQLDFADVEFVFLTALVDLVQVA